jgi:phage virion morphogenesis protein
MADALEDLANWAAPLLQRLEPGSRKTAMQAVAKYLRASQSARIASQRNPDGSPYEPRRPRQQMAQRTGAIRRGMFAGLRQARNLQQRATPDSAMVAMRPNVSRVAVVHHFGLRDKVDRRMAASPTVRYARRELLGYTEADRQAIEDMLLKFIAQGQ